MPTYEYVCTACGNQFEKFQSITADPIKTCPKCGKNKAQRQISGGAGFIFKGGGFYETDYRSEGYKKAAEADKKPAETTAAAASTNTDAAKPAAAAVPAESKPATTPEPAAAPKPAKSAKAKSSK